MPLSTQALYFHLGMLTDDDGVVEAFSVLRIINSNEDDLKLLACKGFITILNDDLVTFINDFRENNTNLRADRKIDSIYKELLIKVIPDVELLKSKKKSKVGYLTDKCQTSVNHLTEEHNRTEHKLTEHKLTEDNIINLVDVVVEILDKKITKGEARLILRDSNNNLEIIKNVYQYSKNQDINNLVGFMRKLVKPGAYKECIQNVKSSGFNNFEPRHYDYDQLEKKLLGWDK